MENFEQPKSAFQKFLDLFKSNKEKAIKKIQDIDPENMNVEEREILIDIDDTLSGNRQGKLDLRDVSKEVLEEIEGKIIKADRKGWY